MGLLDGLYSYEKVLLLLGVLLFIITLFLLVIKLNDKNTANFLRTLLVLSIVMVAWPSIVKIQLFNGMVNIDKGDGRTDQGKEQIEKGITQANPDRPWSADKKVVFAEAYLKLDEPFVARDMLQEAFQEGASSSDAMVLQEKISRNDLIRLSDVSRELIHQPDNPELRREFLEISREADLSRINDREMLMNIAHSSEITGNAAMAEKSLRRVERLDVIRRN